MKQVVYICWYKKYINSVVAVKSDFVLSVVIT